MVQALRRGQDESSFIFQNELGGPLDPDGIYPVLYATQDRAKVNRFGLHGLRYFYSSMLHEAGAPVKHAQDRLGHASATTTMDTYTHSISEEGRKYAAAAEAALPFVSNLLQEGSEGFEEAST